MIAPTIPPELLDKMGGLEGLAELVANLGVAWYAPIAHGGLCLVVAVLANWMISRDLLPHLAYFGCLIFLLSFAVHWANLGRLASMRTLVDVQFGPPVLSLQIEVLLWMGACVVLHLRARTPLSRFFAD